MSKAHISLVRSFPNTDGGIDALSIQCLGVRAHTHFNTLRAYIRKYTNVIMLRY